jgi:hypothetical protein
LPRLTLSSSARRCAHDGRCSMQMANILLREAARLASKQAVRRVHLLAELIDRENLLKQVGQDPNLARLRRDAENCAGAAKRLISYNPEGADGMECPHCWVIDGEHVVLRSDKGNDNLRCANCGRRYGRSPAIDTITPGIARAPPLRRQSSWPVSKMTSSPTPQPDNAATL